jgi:hypothetical protein
MPDHTRMLAFVEGSSDTIKLKALIKNAEAQGVTIVANAARRRLYAVQAKDAPGTLSFDVWQSIHALEDALSDERGKTTRLSRTRQKIGRVGERQTVIDLVDGPVSSGFDMLIERNWPELTFEALVLKHLDDTAIKQKAGSRLRDAGVDLVMLEARFSEK